MIELGRKVEDKVTGFKGLVTGRVEYLTGCLQYLVQPKMGADGRRPEGEWFDEQRLTVVGKVRLVLDNAKSNGPDAPAPKR